MRIKLSGFRFQDQARKGKGLIGRVLGALLILAGASIPACSEKESGPVSPSSALETNTPSLAEANATALPTTPAAKCVVGASVECACAGGTKGVQVCDSNGAFEACDCAATKPIPETKPAPETLAQAVDCKRKVQKTEWLGMGRTGVRVECVEGNPVVIEVFKEPRSPEETESYPLAKEVWLKFWSDWDALGWKTMPTVCPKFEPKRETANLEFKIADADTSIGIECTDEHATENQKRMSTLLDKLLESATPKK